MIEISSFEEIYPYWDKFLWPNRESKILKASSMMYGGGYDKKIATTALPVFWKILDSREIIGINSGFKTANNYFRSRGLWVHPSYRKQGLSQKLLSAAETEAIKQKCLYLWSVPRTASLTAYIKFGFQVTSEPFSEGMEFGPNCYALKQISPIP